MDDKLPENNGDARQDRREKRRKKKRERIPQHGRSLGQLYRDVILKRLKGRGK